MAKRVKMYVNIQHIKMVNGDPVGVEQRVRVDKKSKIVDLMLLQFADQWQKKWFEKNQRLIANAKKNGRPITPSDLEPVYHEMPMEDFKGVKKALGIKQKGEFDLLFDYVNIKGLVRMVRVIGKA